MYLEPVNKIIADLKLEPGDPNGVQAFFTQTCYNHMDKYVPRDTGDLASNVMLNTESIVYISPYAHYMYEGKVMGPNIPIFTKGINKPVGFYSPKGQPKHYTGADIQYHKAGTGDHWDERMKSAEMEQVVKEVQDFIDRGGK